MLKIIGAVLVLSATTAWGFSGVARLRMHVRGLEALGAALAVMQSEICTKLTPIGDIAERLGREAPYPACVFFKNVYKKLGTLEDRSFASIWSDSARETDELMLTGEEVQTLEELGLSLGKYNVEEQRETIARAVDRIEEFRRVAEEKKKKDSKVHAFMGISAGIFAVMIVL